MLFELVYEPFDVDGVKVSEVVRISLDAGSQLDHFQTSLTTQPANKELALAVGIKKAKDQQKEFNAGHGWLAIWEPSEKNQGMQGLTAIVDPRAFDKQAEDTRNNLVVLKPAAGKTSYWAGFAWDRAGKITSAAAWKKYVDDFAQGVLAPIEVTVSLLI